MYIVATHGREAPFGEGLGNERKEHDPVGKSSRSRRAAAEAAINVARQRALVWPASAIQTGLRT
jgi:hypothetical protein